jgi:hypothetical protein
MPAVFPELRVKNLAFQHACDPHVEVARHHQPPERRLRHLDEFSAVKPLEVYGGGACSGGGLV